MLYPRAGCDGNWEHVLCWVPVAISSSCSLPEEQPASSLAGTPVNRRYPLLMLRRIRGEESCVNPHPNPCVMFLSMLTPPLPLFLLPPPISPLPQLLGKKGKTTTNKPRGFCCFWWWVLLLLLSPYSLLWDEVPACIAHSGWCKPTGPLSRCLLDVAPCKQTHFVELVPVCLLFHSV